MSKINGLDVKREITDKRVKNDEGRLALLSGFTRVCLSLTRRGGGALELCLDCQAEFVRDYVASVMMEQFKVKPSVNKTSLVFADCEKLLRMLHILKPDVDTFELCGVPKRFAESSEYVRGAFLGCGSLSVPNADDAQMQKSGGYHLEFSFTNEDIADDFISLFAENGITAHKTVRAERYVVYVKDSESVSDCLAMIGAEKTVLKLNEAVVAFAVKSDVNRINNCDLANMSRTTAAAVELAAAIEIIDKTIGLDSIDPKLAEAAHARIAQPDVPLSKIALGLGISKSGLKHRYDKISALADNIKNKRKTVKVEKNK